MALRLFSDVLGDFDGVITAGEQFIFVVGDPYVKYIVKDIEVTYRTLLFDPALLTVQSRSAAFFPTEIALMQVRSTGETRHRSWSGTQTFDVGDALWLEETSLDCHASIRVSGYRFTS